MAQYKTGTVTVVNGSSVVTGLGTSWLGHVADGDWFKIDDLSPIYHIGHITSNTQLELTANYAGTSGSGLSYCIVTDFTANHNLPLMAKGDIDWPDIWNRAMNIIDELL